MTYSILYIDFFGVFFFVAYFLSLTVHHIQNHYFLLFYVSFHYIYRNSDGFETACK